MSLNRLFVAEYDRSLDNVRCREPHAKEGDSIGDLVAMSELESDALRVAIENSRSSRPIMQGLALIKANIVFCLSRRLHLACGVIFPFFVHKLIEKVGFRVTVRYVALLIGTLLSCACFLVKPRMPRKGWSKDSKWVDFTLFKDPTFALYTSGAFFVILGLWAPFDYLPSMALSHGFSDSLSIYLISIINAGSIPGRILPGHLADTIGYFNTMTTVCILAGLSIIMLWTPFTYHPSHVGIIFFAFIYGFLSGAFISLMMPCCAKSGTIETLGQRFGTFQFAVGIGCLVGLPIGGAILNTGSEGYLGLQVFSAVVMVGGGLVIGGARVSKAGWGLRKRA
ncbi:hypothetical protein DSL72_001705 [Monilinia vaccinii-corymbosi]|uniref:Major facilitator superfamily (MFS) profile domain-containing protein n=1 Tax=Monilinia vaccinii-corymbosi TaxID=61207 RepID=A0A8A3P7S7_9HELO|nr:hypothetical protein DSL72_001705 [Monilinia vaccinii-corymbosi]